MRKLAILMTAALATATPALAEQVVLRVEAKRGAQGQAAAEGWAGRFPAVVTFPLPGGWTGIGLGPMERAAAEAELARLKAAGEIPGDSFIAPAPADATVVAGTAAGTVESVAPTGNPAAGASTFVPPDVASGMAVEPLGGGDRAGRPVAETADAPTEIATTDAGDAAETAAAEDTPADAPADAAVVGLTPPAGDYLRLQRFETRELADEALAKWRADFPEAGLWQQPDGGFAVTLGPLPAATAEAWLSAFRKAERVGKPGAVLPVAELGTVVEAGQPIDLPGPGTAPMPPLIEVQRALRWAGHYDGRIDGKDGPQTQAAIAAEVLALRAAPDAPTAMQALIERRVAWRDGMGLTQLDDPLSGLSVVAPMDRLAFDRNEQGLSIYGPKDGSGAALILYSAPGGQQEMLDFTGLVTALGWVPAPERKVDPGHASLKGRNDTHIGQAEARVVEGRVEGLVLIWPVADEADQPRVAAELIDSMARTPVAPPAPEAATEPAASDAPPAPGPAAPDMPGDAQAEPAE